MYALWLHLHTPTLTLARVKPFKPQRASIVTKGRYSMLAENDCSCSEKQHICNLLMHLQLSANRQYSGMNIAMDKELYLLMLAISSVGSKCI